MIKGIPNVLKVVHVKDSHYFIYRQYPFLIHFRVDFGCIINLSTKYDSNGRLYFTNGIGQFIISEPMMKGYVFESTTNYCIVTFTIKLQYMTSNSITFPVIKFKNKRAP